MSDTNPNQDTPIDQLRARADQASDLEKALAAKDRELAFARAGIADISDGPGKYLFQGYDGELDPEAIKAEALKLGIGAPATPPNAEPPPVVLTPEELAAHNAAGSVADGGAPPETNSGPDPQTRGLTEFREALKNGATREEASAFFADAVIGAAANGDERVILRRNS